eukprot:CAMPEP_0177672224 /NCGR_PEP_ID=MMETSP0447-20121125/25199_1 /TAXON_ID=0 /ORGANISM="Stygamoeba regulata, Strain BSH-02190019" /LENGTH=84 /DNA_ID=CAMNT_0019179821 /DNA_START=269 /DNA_END=520 /DNA_ORIENTATION=-
MRSGGGGALCTEVTVHKEAGKGQQGAAARQAQHGRQAQAVHRHAGGDVVHKHAQVGKRVDDARQGAGEDSVPAGGVLGGQDDER